MIGVAARLADEHHLDARDGHLRRVRRGVDGNLVERSHVDVVPESFGALR